MAIVRTPQLAPLPIGYVHTGDAADDVFTPTNRADTFYGGNGDDSVMGFLSDGDGDVFFGGAGSDIISDQSSSYRAYGGEGSDEFVGGFGRDIFFGGEGRDDLTGGSGNDMLDGGFDGDYLDGHDGDDVLFGGWGVDALYGGAGNDTLTSGIGDDIMNGGEGDDTYFAHDNDNGRDPGFFHDHLREDLPYSAGGGVDTVFSYAAMELPENFEILRLIGNAAGGSGNDGDNVIVGNNRNNYLAGRGGDDRIIGGAGIDTLVGNSGSDTLVGGEGSDRFVFTSIADSREGAENRDFINGIDHYDDRIDLRQIDANTYNGAAVNDAWTWIGTDAFDGTWGTSAGQLRYMTLGEHNAVIVEGDHNGDGVADFQIFVNGTDFMSVGDFLM